MKTNRGAVLPTVIALLFITTFLLLSHSWTTKQQVTQLHMFRDSYRLKAMLAMSEKYLENHVKKESILESIEFEFKEGAVHATYTPPAAYELTGTLPNGVSATKSFEFKALEKEIEEEVEEETEEVKEEQKTEEVEEEVEEEKKEVNDEQAPPLDESEENID